MASSTDCIMSFNRCEKLMAAITGYAVVFRGSAEGGAAIGVSVLKVLSMGEVSAVSYSLYHALSRYIWT
ncbi:hypothetical protein D3C80_1000790 [compost metagenome]